MTQIYLIRHGKRESMDPNSGLSKKGKIQAVALGKLFKNIVYHILYTSDQKRALETAKEIIKYNKKSNFIKTELLGEVHASLVGGKLGEDNKRKELDIKRADKAFQDIFENAKNNDRMLVVCHGNIIKYFLKKILKLKNVDLWHQMHMDSASITIIEGKKDLWIIKTINSIEHLGLSYRNKFYKKEYSRTE